jgi:hypothetical protein
LTEEAAAKAQANPHPPGSVAGAVWDLDHAVQDLFAPFWDWMLARSPRQLLIAVAICFVILVALSIAAGSFVPLALGVILWFVGGLCVGRGTQRS